MTRPTKNGVGIFVTTLCVLAALISVMIIHSPTNSTNNNGNTPSSSQSASSTDIQDFKQAILKYVIKWLNDTNQIVREKLKVVGEPVLLGINKDQGRALINTSKKYYSYIVTAQKGKAGWTVTDISENYNPDNG